jgi:hypothetical protein
MYSDKQFPLSAKQVLILVQLNFSLPNTALCAVGGNEGWNKQLVCVHSTKLLH